MLMIIGLQMESYKEWYSKLEDVIENSTDEFFDPIIQLIIEMSFLIKTDDY